MCKVQAISQTNLQEVPTLVAQLPKSVRRSDTRSDAKGNLMSHVPYFCRLVLTPHPLLGPLA